MEAFFECGWARDPRRRAIAGLAHTRFQMEYVVVPEAVRRARCDRRWLETPETTFKMTAADHDRFLALCRPPTQDELDDGPMPAPPEGCDTWARWASRRWPTLPCLDR